MRLARVTCILLAALALLAPAGTTAAAPTGPLTWDVHLALAPTYFAPAETPGVITPFMVLYALHDAVIKPMPDRRWAPSLAESWTQSERAAYYAEYGDRKLRSVLYTGSAAFGTAATRLQTYVVGGGRYVNHGLNVITGFAYSAPYEDLTLRKK